MAINSYPDNSGGEVNFPDQLIDPVSKFRVSNPENLIDTDFEYGLQPTKWETVELINNTPSFFSKSGDTTIDGISSIITNAGTREIIVKTELAHGLAVGIPINVTGTKSITADGAYIINSIPDPQTFTYLCKDNQSETNSILDLYSSIITGEFFQGSQLRISDSDGIVTDAEGTSILTVTTNTTHGFGENTPFYFLNLNSTVAQEFQAANTASKTFDASNSATAQTFDGSNSLSSVNIDWSNSATFGGTPSTVSATSVANDTITVTHQAGENFAGRPVGTPLYYSVSSTGGYFNTNPRGVVFLKTIANLGTSTSTFQVSLVPDGDPINLTENLSGTFQIANQARTFAGNNIDPLTQSVINIEVSPSFNFDGGNQGYSGIVQETPPNNTVTVLSYTGSSINADGASSVDYYVGAMLLYTTSGTAPTGLTTNTTYFVTSFTNNSGGNYTFSVAALPGGTPISFTGTGGGTQTFSKIGVSTDKDIVHIFNSNFAEGDMLEYTFPVDGRFDVGAPEQEKMFYFVDEAYDSHNYKLSEDIGFKPIVATGGTILPDVYENGRVYRVHQFTTVGTSTFTVTEQGEGLVEYLVVGGGGGGGPWGGGGGAGGGVRSSVAGYVSGRNSIPESPFEVAVGAYTVTVGAGGGRILETTPGSNAGGSSSFATITALGGGGGGGRVNTGGTVWGNASNGGSGGGATWVFSGSNGVAGTGAAGQGFEGGTVTWVNSANHSSAGGGGAGSRGITPAGVNDSSGDGGNGVLVNITGRPLYWGGGGGGAIHFTTKAGNGGLGGGGGGIGGGKAGDGGSNGINLGNPPTETSLGATAGNGGDAGANTGGGGGAGGGAGANNGGLGGSGIVILRYPITPPLKGNVINATGGTITSFTENGVIYREHRFTNTGSSTFEVTNVSDTPENNRIHYLIVAGGGPGGLDAGGGGGGGGVVINTGIVTTGSYPVTVGAGGAVGNNGGNSTFFSRTALGGGQGGNTNVGGVAGGSGGGAGRDTTASGGATTQPSSASGGFGAVGGFGTGVSWSGGGGGGGAAQPGGRGGLAGPSNAAQSGTNLGDWWNGNGGDGVVWLDGRFYGGGGGASAHSLPYALQGGLSGYGGRGGGGNGTNLANAGSYPPDFNRAATAGQANTGGGGGGGWSGIPGNTSQPGGSGIVVVRYPIGVAVSSQGPYISATGGTTNDITVGGIVYRVHRFTDVGTSRFNILSTATVPENNSIEYLVVAGGGGGSDDWSGGGGGGGMLTGSVTINRAMTYPITVGNGGAGGFNFGAMGFRGGDSSALGITTYGGGGGGSDQGVALDNGMPGGSGGGGAIDGVGGTGTSGQGNSGANGNRGANLQGGGGGGAGGAGSGRQGGAGRSSSITGTATFYAGGGSSNANDGTVTAGGSGGGGAGHRDGSATQGTDGLGGGGGASNTGGRRGGSGIVILRYPIGVA
jgi:hypothetical protein